MKKLLQLILRNFLSVIAFYCTFLHYDQVWNIPLISQNECFTLNCETLFSFHWKFQKRYVHKNRRGQINNKMSKWKICAWIWILKAMKTQTLPEKSMAAAKNSCQSWFELKLFTRNLYTFDFLSLLKSTPKNAGSFFRYRSKLEPEPDSKQNVITRNRS